MTDEELVSLCERVKTQVRGPMLDICMEVLERYAAKNLATKPAKSRDMAKYMREWRAKRNGVGKNAGLAAAQVARLMAEPVSLAEINKAERIAALKASVQMASDQKALASVPEFPSGDPEGNPFE